MDKLQSTNIDSKIRSKLADSLKETTESKKINDIVQVGIVVSNADPKNNKRIKVRIPVLDDHYFKNKETGIDNLPWSLPISKRLVDVPEENSVVLVINFSIQDKSKARIYFDVFDLLSEKDIFDSSRLIENEKNKWKDAEKLIGRKYDVSDEIEKKPYSTKNNKTEKRVGLKGKGENYFILDEKQIEITQNKDKDNESNLKLNEKFQATPAKEIELLSKKSNEKKKPIFAEDFTELFDALISFGDALEKVLTINPATSTPPGTPATAGPSAPSISTTLSRLKSQYFKFKQSGISKNILIN